MIRGCEYGVAQTISTFSTSPQAAARLFVDLDGVLADFDHGVLEVTGRLPHQLVRLLQT